MRRIAGPRRGPGSQAEKLTGLFSPEFGQDHSRDNRGCTRDGDGRDAFTECDDRGNHRYHGEGVAVVAREYRAELF